LSPPNWEYKQSLIFATAQNKQSLLLRSKQSLIFATAQNKQSLLLRSKQSLILSASWRIEKRTPQIYFR